MERPIFECIAYDLGDELEDLKKYKKDIDAYVDYLEKKLNKIEKESKINPK